MQESKVLDNKCYNNYGDKHNSTFATDQPPLVGVVDCNDDKTALWSYKFAPLRKSGKKQPRQEDYF